MVLTRTRAVFNLVVLGRRWILESYEIMKTDRRNEKGFTLIELLVVVAIIGILSATAITQYAAIKSRAFNARAVSDLKNIISSQEAQFVDSETFIDDISLLTGFDTTSPAVTAVLTADVNGWTGMSYHPNGTKTYCYNSTNNSGLVIITGTNAACP